MTRMIALDDVKALLPIRGTNTAYDARINDIIATVSRMIEAECRQTFTMAQRVETHTARQSFNRALDLYGDGWGTNCATLTIANEQILPLRASPISDTDPVTVWYDPMRQFTDDTIIPQEFWSIDTAPEMSRVLLTYPTRYVRSGLRVRYTAGYAPDANGTLSESLKEQAPDLFQACLLGCLHEWNRSSPELVGTDKSSEVETARLNGPNSFGLPKETLIRLVPYRRVLTGRG